MPRLAQIGSVICVISLVLAFDSGIATAGLSSICVAADASAASLLVQVKDKKRKNHDQDAGLTECTILGAGGGGGCKSGFNWKCEKLKSGKKCCGCVADKDAKAQQAPTQAEPGGAEKKGDCDWLYCNLNE